jgi:hypothetical protein
MTWSSRLGESGNSPTRALLPKQWHADANLRRGIISLAGWDSTFGLGCISGSRRGGVVL